jgi:hypothetical protein
MANQLEDAMAELKSILQDQPPSGLWIDQTANPCIVLHAAHRDLTSAHALLLRASLARSGVIRRLLRAALGRPLSVSAGAEAGGEIALDPIRPTLVRCAFEAEGLVSAATTLRCSIADREVEAVDDVAERPDPVVNFAGGMVDGAIENLEEARDLLYGAAELTDNGLARLWSERIAGGELDQEQEQSGSRGRRRSA